MEESKKTWNGQEKKKMVTKIGGGGGGIGAVVLLCGAFATAALASAFIVRKKRRRRHHQNPPPEINKESEQDEANKGQQFIFLDQPSHVNKSPSSGATKEVESDNDTGLLLDEKPILQDEKPGIEINGGTPGDVYDVEPNERRQILRSISFEKLENDAISDDSVIIEEGFPSLDEKLPFEPKHMMHEDEAKIQLTKEDVSNEISKASENFEQVYIEEVRAEREASDDGENEGMNHKEAVEIAEMQPREEEKTDVRYDQEEIEVTIVDNAVKGVHIDQMEALKNVNMEEKELEGFCSDNGEINVEKCQESIEKTEKDVAAIGLELSEDRTCGTQEAIGSYSSLSETIGSESHSEDGQKAVLYVFDSPVLKHENVNDDEKERALPMEIVEIIQEDDAIEGSQEDEVKYIEEQLFKEEEKCDRSDEGIVPQKCEEVGRTGEANRSNLQSDLQIEMGEKKIHCENKEEKTWTGSPTPENRQFGIQLLQEELISPEDIEVTKENGANEGTAESVDLKENKTSTQFAVCQPKDHQDDLERNIAKEVDEELISPEDIEITKEDGANEEVAESVEVSGNKTSTQFVFGQPKQHEDDVERNIVKEIEGSSETTATAKNDMIMEMSEDEENGEDETALSDEVEESSEGTGDSSMESNSEPVWPAESLQASIEPQQVKLIDQDVEGKIQEDKAVNKGEHDYHDSQIIGEDSCFEPQKVKAEERNSQKSSDNFAMVADSSQFPDGKGNSEKTSIKKYAVELATLKIHPTNSTRRRMLIGALSVLSSLSCSWFFGLSFVKLCLIVFLTMLLSKIHGH